MKHTHTLLGAFTCPDPGSQSVREKFPLHFQHFIFSFFKVVKFFANFEHAYQISQTAFRAYFTSGFCLIMCLELDVLVGFRCWQEYRSHYFRIYYSFMEFLINRFHYVKWFTVKTIVRRTFLQFEIVLNTTRVLYSTIFLFSIRDNSNKW